MDELNFKITIVGLAGFSVLTLLIIFFIITVLRNQKLKVNLERDGTGLYAIKDKIQIHSKR